MCSNFETVACKDCVESSEDLWGGGCAGGTEQKVKLSVMNTSVFFRVTIAAMKRHDQTS